MTIKKPVNSNYAAVVVSINTIVPLEGCDFVQAAIILGNQVIVGKDIQVGDVGIYFPLECQLSKEYLSANNLYRKVELNKDNTKKGYFEENGRIRCVKFRGHKSEGLFMPLESINFCTTDHEEFTLGTEFDYIGGTEICRKYVVVVKNTNGTPKSGKGRGNKAKETKLIDGQFRFHDETSMLYKNLHRIKHNDLISITYKLHGTSGISSYLLCNKPLKWYEKLLKYVVTVVTTNYDYIYSSRNVIKNSELNPNANHFYEVNIWGIADERLRPFLQEGMTFYYEIVGYLPNGAMIQKSFDYGYTQPASKEDYQYGINYGIYIYRITYTNPSGKVFEFSAKQVQDFCMKNALKAVPELYYGRVLDFMNLPENVTLLEGQKEFHGHFLDIIKKRYNEKDCYMCNNKVPEEGCVIRIEGLEFEAYKQKSNAFYALETKLLDQGISDIETEN